MIYLQKLDDLKKNKDEKKYFDNMSQMLEMGYSNYEVNLNLLKRNHNDLINAVNSLCNGLVTDSMFMLV